MKGFTGEIIYPKVSNALDDDDKDRKKGVFKTKKGLQITLN